MLLLILTIAITCIASYFVVRLDEKHQIMNTLIFVSVFGVCVIPSLIIFISFDYFNIEGLNVIPATLPLILMGLLAVWATWGESESGKSTTDDKKDDFVADAIILTTVLSNNESKSDSSNNSNSSGSSSSNSDDFFLL